MTEIIEEMQVYYERRAVLYDSSMGYDRIETLQMLRPVIDAICDLVAGRTVLEIACGPGFWTQQICSAVKAILATDYNEATLAVARQKDIDRNKVSFQVADAYRLPPFPMQFDSCMAIDWFAHIPRSRMQEFLESLHRTLTRGGRVVFCDQLPGPHSLTGSFDAEGNHYQERALPDGTNYRVVKHFFSDDEYRSLFQRYTADFAIRRFEECRRVVVTYSI